MKLIQEILSGQASMRLLGIVACAVLIGCYLKPPSSPAGVTFGSVTFSDEFLGRSIDASQWNTCQWPLVNSPSACKPFNDSELQWYTRENVAVDRGMLRLRAQRQQLAGKAFTSGIVSTLGKRNFRYGRFAVRFRVPAGKGFWPAIWLAPSDLSWPPEIDMIEVLGQSPDVAYLSLHTASSDGARQKVGISHSGHNLSAGFHTVILEWTPRSLVWFLDNAECFRVSNAVPHKDMYLIMNLAVGGDWPQPPDATTLFPAYFDIDTVSFQPLVDS